MKTFKDVDEFIMEVMPLEHQKIIREKISVPAIEKSIIKADARFDKRLAEIIAGKEEKQKETPSKNGKGNSD
jgi:hypothetical protein